MKLCSCTPLHLLEPFYFLADSLPRPSDITTMMCYLLILYCWNAQKWTSFLRTWKHVSRYQYTISL